MVDDLLLLYS